MSQRSLFSAKAPPPPVGPGPVTIEGEVVRVTFENEGTGFRVLRVAVEGRNEPEVWVGVIPPAPPGTRVRATGKYERDAKHGDQLKVETLLPLDPSTAEGIARYLGSGMVRGIGAKYAKRIVETFGDQTLEVLDRDPSRLTEVPGLGGKRAGSVAEAWAQSRAVSAIMIFLQGHDVSISLANRIYKRFGTHAIEVVKRNPYRLALDVWGVGFKTADRIAESLGVRRDSPERAQAGVLQTLNDLTGRGHVFAERRDLVAASALMLDLDEAPVDEALSAIIASHHVVSERLNDGTEAIFPRELYEAERRVASRLTDLLRARSRAASRLTGGAAEAIRAFEEHAKVALDPAQRDAVERASTNKVLVITGGPGVGKTTIVRAVLSLFERAKVPVRLAAPTGRAAKRMSEATRREATTLHRLLELDPKRGFSRGAGRPIDAGAVIVDESSMIDVALADALLQAIPEDAHLILVGDVDQLPSVGPGAVLRDVIVSGVVPTVRLTKIFRQAEGSLIVQNAHRIHEGQRPEGHEGKRGEFYVFDRSDPKSAADTILDLVVNRIPRGFGLDPRTDVQVLTPIHKGDVGTIALNERLQAALNPSGFEVSRGTKKLRVGDKVMQLKNDHTHEVYNGDVGFVSSFDHDSRTITVRFDEREVEYDDTELDELALAYATSVHKSQGSEYKAVIIPVLTQHYVMLSRNLVYTAVTRGKQLVVLVADPKAIDLALAETRREERRTYLGERLRLRLGAG